MRELSSSFGTIEVGDLVRHYGTQQWGTVLKVRGPDNVPWRDGSQEILVRRHLRSSSDNGWSAPNREGWWSSFAIDRRLTPRDRWSLVFARIAAAVALATVNYQQHELPTNLAGTRMQYGTAVHVAISCLMQCAAIEGCLLERDELRWRSIQVYPDDPPSPMPWRP